MIHPRLQRLFATACAALLVGCASAPPPLPPVAAPSIAAPPARPPLRIGLALGGGAARGFAHVGVIKALEAQGIYPEIIAGTSAGSVVGALYAAGLSGFDLNEQVLQIGKTQFTDWTLSGRGLLKGEALQDFVNHAVGGRPMEKLGRQLAVVSTDLQSGESVVFRVGNTGMAVRASSSVPGVFVPVEINGREYVDGGLVSPVPVRVARDLGANFVIAVDISARPADGKLESTVDVLLQAFSIMGQRLARAELPYADVVIRPYTSVLVATSTETMHRAVLEGERAVAAVLPELKAKLAKLR